MNRITLGVALVSAFVIGQAASLADEVRSTSVGVSTPEGTATNSVTTKSDATGSSTKVENTSSNSTGSASRSYSAAAGPDGAKVSATKTNTQTNGDGSVSSNRTHESHAINDAGSVDRKSAQGTTFGADGSTATEKHESTSTHP